MLQADFRRQPCCLFRYCRLYGLCRHRRSPLLLAALLRSRFFLIGVELIRIQILRLQLAFLQIAFLHEPVDPSLKLFVSDESAFARDARALPELDRACILLASSLLNYFFELRYYLFSWRRSCPLNRFGRRFDELAS